MTASLPHDGTLLLSATVGSTAYGLAGPDSDVDTLGVYRAATDIVLGVDGPAAVKHSHVTTSPDITVHEVGKYVSLALKANPTVLELLWACDAPNSVRTTAGNLLIDHRRAFLSAPAIRSAYGGYATQQARRLLNRHREGRDGFNSDLRLRTAKHGRHCYRLLLMGRELIATGNLALDVSVHRDLIFQVGDLAVTDPERFSAVFDTQRSLLDAEPSCLPDQPLRDVANNVLVRIRKMEMS